MPAPKIEIIGSAIVGKVLTTVHDLDEFDGVGKITLQWYKVNKNNKSEIIKKATNAAYTITSDMVGFTIKVIASYEQKKKESSIEAETTVVKGKQVIRFHSRRKSVSRGNRARSGRSSVFFRQPAMWHINHPTGRSNTME